MKTSKKILITVAGTLIVILIVTMVVLRRDINSLLSSQELIEYKLIPTEKFISVNFSTDWIVLIKQGKDCKVEVAIEESNNIVPMLRNVDGILYLNFDTLPGKKNTPNYARITAPALNVIKAKGNSEILMKNFWTDSLTIVLEDSSKFSGKNNDIPNLIFKASNYDKKP